MKSLILYWSSSGNTLKVANAVKGTLVKNDVPVDCMEINENLDVNICDYDLVFFGAPSIQWIPPVPVQKFIKNAMDKDRKGVRPIGAPKKSGKFSVAFCTYGGVHTGEKEGYTCGKYMAQFLEHMGFFVLDEWYTPGRFQGFDNGSKYGALGDITNRPNEQDLNIIANKTSEILQGLNFLK